MTVISDSMAVRYMSESCKIVKEVLDTIEAMVKPGVTTMELNRKAEEVIQRNNAKAAFKGYQIPGLNPFPAAVCASINSCIVHGIPSEDVELVEGDIIGIDVGVYKNGYYGDAAKTFPVGTVSVEADKLLQVTREALSKAIEHSVAGNKIGDISNAIGSYVISQGFFIADRLTGHGVGKKLHQDPVIPNSGRPGTGQKLKPGMTLAIEPMVNVGTNRVYERGWEFFVADNSLSAHFEHTILVTEDKPVILTN